MVSAVVLFHNNLLTHFEHLILLLFFFVQCLFCLLINALLSFHICHSNVKMIKVDHVIRNISVLFLKCLKITNNYYFVNSQTFSFRKLSQLLHHIFSI